MSLDQINDYGIGNVNLTSLMETLDRQRRGYQAISLTHYDDNLEPKIAAGSIVELGGALFKCEADESITGWAGIGNGNDVYIKLVPSGTTATAAFVTAAPTWSTSKQGWYVGNDRYIGGLYKDGSGNYTIKWLYAPEDTQNLLREGKTRPLLEKVVEIGDWDMNVDVSHTAAHGLPNHLRIRLTDMKIRNDTNTVLYSISIVNAAIVLQGGLFYIDDTNITMYRLTDGAFDSAQFETPPDGNRGWIHIKYQA